MKKIVVMVSGFGSNLQAIIEAIQAKRISGQICAVISNKASAYALERAKAAGIATFVFQRKSFADNEAMDLAIADQIDKLGADLIVLAGYMKILTSAFTYRFAGKILNIHPSLLPKYPGLNSHQRAVEAGEKDHGMTIHFVNDIVDGGAIVLQAKVPIYPEDTLEEIEDRVQEQEHRCYPLVIQWFCQGRLTLQQQFAYLDHQRLPPQGYALDE